MMKTAIVYDRVNKWGGAERVLLTLHEMFPDAPLYTSVYDEKKAPWAKVFPKIYFSFLQKIPFAKGNHELLAPLMPIAFEQFDFGEYDLVVSVTSESAKGIITRPGTTHVCYCLTPTRYLWSGYEEYFKNPFLRFISKPIISYLRSWDKVAASRPDKIIAISTEVQKRIRKYYDRDSEIIFPSSSSLYKKIFPRRSRSMSVSARKIFLDKAHYLLVSRLDFGYKKVGLVVNVFNQLKLPLAIIGGGRLAYSLQHKAGNNVKFVGQISDEELANYYINAKELIMPQEEDFGIVAVEAQSFGVAVIAYSKGGSRDTVRDGLTGVLFNEQSEASLAAAIEKFVKMSFNSRALITNANKFSKEKFKEKFLKLIK